MSTNPLKQYPMTEGKRKINNAFNSLRKKGYFARQNFWCCNTCGWHAVPEDQIEKVVFYHSQAADDLKDTGECWLSWSGNAYEIIQTFESAGVPTSWDGDPSKKIKIIQP